MQQDATETSAPALEEDNLQRAPRGTNQQWTQPGQHTMPSTPTSLAASTYRESWLLLTLWDPASRCSCRAQVQG